MTLRMCGFLGLLVATTLPVQAQQMAMAGTLVAQQGNRRTSQTVNLSLEGVSLESALREVARQAGMGLSFTPSDVNLTRTVSVQVKDASVMAALEAVVAGTGVRAVVAPNGKTIILSKRSTPQVQGIITGRVLHAKTKQPVVGAQVTVVGSDQTVETDKAGTFRMSVSAGEYKLNVRALGLVRQTITVVVDEDQSQAVEVIMEPSASVLNEVVVTGTVVATERKAIATPITVIHAEEIERRGITRIDQLFRGEIPGLLAMEVGSNAFDLTGRERRGGIMRSTQNTAGTATTKMYSRGASSIDGEANPIKTYIDGVELLDPSYLGTIDPRSIERIEVITGPQAATIYGSGALGGVMQIFTKKGSGASTPDVTVTLRYGVLESNSSSGNTPSHNHAVMVTGGMGPALSYSLNLSYGYTGQWAPALFQRSIGASIGAVHTNGPFTVNGALSVTNGSNGTLAVQSNTGGSPFVKSLVASGEWNCGMPNGAIDNCAQSFQSSQRVSRRMSQTVSVNADYRMGQYIQHHGTLGRVQNNFDLDPLGPGLSSPQDTMFSYASSDGQRTTAAYNMTIAPPAFGWMAHVLTIGANGGWGENTRTSGTAPSADAPTWTTSTVTRIFDDKTWGGFASWRVGFLDQLYFTLGLRAERNRAYGEDHKVDWTPTNGVTYTFETGELSVKLLASYGRATRAPAAEQRLEILATPTGLFDPDVYTEQFPNSEIAPEYEAGPQGGIELYYGNRGSLTINRYSQRVTNLLYRATVDSVDRVYLPGFPPFNIYTYKQYQWVNIAKVKKQGWETTGSLNLGALTLRGTYSWNDSRIADMGSITGTSYHAGQSFRFIPTHTGNMIATYAYRGTSVTWVMNYVGMRPIDSNALPIDIAWNTYRRLQQYVHRKNSMAGSYRKEGYIKSDLAAQHRLTPWASLTVNVTNLGNSFADDNANSLAPALGRQTLFGLSLRYPTRR